MEEQKENWIDKDIVIKAVYVVVFFLEMVLLTAMINACSTTKTVTSQTSHEITTHATENLKFISSQSQHNIVATIDSSVATNVISETTEEYLPIISKDGKVQGSFLAKRTKKDIANKLQNNIRRAETADAQKAISAKSKTKIDKQDKQVAKAITKTKRGLSGGVKYVIILVILIFIIMIYLGVRFRWFRIFFKELS